MDCRRNRKRGCSPLLSMLITGILISLFSTGCSSGSGPQTQEGDNSDIGGNAQAQVELLAMIANSSSPDTDNDFLPDDVEEHLGTKPDDRDSDHDGIPDFEEIFNTGTDNENDPPPDKNNNGLIAALDPDDNSDGINDGQQLDSDGDGISNYLEYYGFTYNWINGQYAPWDGIDYTARYYKTDPYQKSTDQDPFDDPTEVAGVNMDVSVQEPGNLPMVPAYPDIVVRLEGYSVTLNKEITWSEGNSLAEGTTWERTAETTHSNTTENTWEVGVSATVNYSAGSFGGSTTFHANYGETSGTTSGTSNSVSSGNSILSEQNWSRASTENPTDAARIKLFLKVCNRGTAVASNVIPTITLKIGGHNIATFEQGNAQINILEPGGVYPEQAGIYWVVDSIDTGAGIAPISLTMSELKALESGGPVSITLTQMAADVMLKNPATGIYESAGDWNEYMARIEAVSASLFFDLGDGNTIRSYVYADDSITSPVVTLGDAIVWLANGKQHPDTGEIFITCDNAISNSSIERSIEGWHFSIDGETYEANGFNDTNTMPEEFNIVSLRLKPGASVIAKAPREQIAELGPGPEIQVAYYDPNTGITYASASDYNGVETVVFIDKNGISRPMSEDMPGSAFYVYAPGQDTENYPEGYEFSGTELVRATNVNNAATTTLFVSAYTQPVPEAPDIVSVSVDLDLHKLYAHVESTLPLDASPAFVRVYGEIFTTDLGYGDGYCDMRRVSNWFEDPTGWVCDLEPSWTTFPQIEGITVVAYAGPDLYTSREVTAADQHIHTTGNGMMQIIQEPDLTGFIEQLDEEVIFDILDLDTGSLFWWRGWPGTDFTLRTEAGYEDCDVWLRVLAYDYLYTRFGVEFSYLDPQDYPDIDFNSITRGDIQAISLEPAYGVHSIHYGVDNIFVYRTSDGRYGKIRLKPFSWWEGSYTLHGFGTYGRVGAVEYEFVTFLPAP